MDDSDGEDFFRGTADEPVIWYVAPARLPSVQELYPYAHVHDYSGACLKNRFSAETCDVVAPIPQEDQ